MDTLRLFLIQTTIAGSITTIVYLLLQPLLHKALSPQWHYGIIKMIALFFIFPVPLAATLYTHFQARSMPIILDTLNSPVTGTIPPVSEDIIFPFVQPLLETIPKTVDTGRLGDIFFIVWILGMFAFTLRQVLSYWLFFRRTVKFNTGRDTAGDMEVMLCNEIAAQMGFKKEIHLVTNSKVHGPMVFFGVFNTVILPDTAIDKEDLRYVLFHELTHIKRRDLWNKIVFVCICTVHWFNPLCRALYKQMDTWCELSCDAAVIKNLTSRERKEYGLSILNLASASKTRQNLLCTSYACNKKNLKRRLNMLLKQSRYLKTKIAFSLAFTMLIGSVGFSSGVLAANLEIAKSNPSAIEISPDVTVLETSPITGEATLIQWNERLYKLNKEHYLSNEMLESSDQGVTWHEFNSNYDTMKILYNSFGVALQTQDEYMEHVDFIRERAENPQPSYNANYVSTLVRYESVLSQWENDETITNIGLLLKRLEYEYAYDISHPAQNDMTPLGAVALGYNLEMLYNSMKEHMESDVELGNSTQEGADRIWKEFTSIYNLPE